MSDFTSLEYQGFAMIDNVDKSTCYSRKGFPYAGGSHNKRYLYHTMCYSTLCYGDQVPTVLAVKRAHDGYLPLPPWGGAGGHSPILPSRLFPPTKGVFIASRKDHTLSFLEKSVSVYTSSATQSVVTVSQGLGVKY